MVQKEYDTSSMNYILVDCWNPKFYISWNVNPSLQYFVKDEKYE